MQWIQDPSQSNAHYLNNVRREVSRHFRNKKKAYPRAKIEELETNSKIQNIRDLYRSISDIIQKVCTSNSLISWHQVRNKYGLQQKLCEGIQYTVLLKSGQKFWGNVITKIKRLSNRMTRTRHTFHSSLKVSLNHITVSVLKNYVKVPQKMDMKMHSRMIHVGSQVMDTLFLFGFYDNLYYRQGAHFYSMQMPKKKYQYTPE